MAGVSSEPSVQDGTVSRIGTAVLDAVCGVGDLARFTGQMVAWLFTRLPKRGSFVPVLYQVGVRSVPVVMITGTFIGMVLAIQAYYQFSLMHMETRLGSIVNISLLKELGPVLAATMLAGRVGSSMAAELGTMRVTEQIDALSCLGANPIHYLVVPRFLACFFLIPLLTAIADIMGIIGGALVCIEWMGVSSYHYWYHSRQFIDNFDIFSGIVKCFFFGGAIAIISCHRGLNSQGGAEGVGRAATEAFVYSFIMILALDFLLNVLLKGVSVLVWPEAGPTLM